MLSTNRSKADCICGEPVTTVASVPPSANTALDPTATGEGATCDEACNAHARALARARQLARAQVPADHIEAVLVCELGLEAGEAADLVTGAAPVLFVESRCGRGELAEYLWRLGIGEPGLAKHATSVSLAAATLLARHHLGLDGVSPDEKVRKLLQQAEVDAERRLANRDRRGRHLTVAGGRAA